MSIETLLEAAKFLELQAQQQQKTREENELRERLRQEQEAEQRKRKEMVTAVPAARVNNNNHHHYPHHQQQQQHHHVTWVEEPSSLERRLAPQPPPPPLPITVIPIPVVPSAPAPTAFPPAPNTACSPPTTTVHHPQGSPSKDVRSPTGQHVLISQQPEPEPISLAQTAAKQQQHQQQQQPAHLLQPYPGTIVTGSQHALPPQPGPQPPQTQSSPVSRSSPPDDSRNADGKKRPGGAGTREVHNKLEKNRRAHLKECFETLKKNIPNVDEKKASNLSVLRSALRYIQTLKRKEKEFEHEMERLAREKIATQQRLAELKNELSQWMDVLEIDRLLRQTVQPEDDQASTSTASEGEDNIDEDIEEQSPSAAAAAVSPKVPQAPQPEPRKPLSVPTKAPLLNNNHHHHHHPAHQHHHQPPTPTIQHKLSAQLALTVPQTVQVPVSAPLQVQVQAATAVSTPIPAPTTIPGPGTALSPVTSSPLQAPTLVAPQALLTAHAHIVTAPANSSGGLTNGLVQPTTVIAHAAPATHASVIQATVNHIIQPAGKQQPQPTQALQQQQQPPAHTPHTTLAHLAPSPTAAPQPIGHITVHPVAHLSQHHLPALYPQPVATVTQPAVVSHIAHTLSHAQVNGASPGQVVGKAPTAGATATAMGAQVVAHHPQLVGQTVLNPVTMVTMPSFPVSTLKLA